MDAMIEAGFNSVFVGIETPNPEALIKMKKPQNVREQEDDYLLDSVRAIQQKGMRVDGGFILGVDGDDESAFDAQIDFIRQAGIPMAMAGLLNVLRGTALYDRLKRENRLLEEAPGTGGQVIPNLSGANVVLNFKPEMAPEILIEGYRRVIDTLYDSTLENYFTRCLTLFEHLKPVPHLLKPITKNALFVAMMAVRRRLSAKQLPAYNRYIAKVSKDHPRMLPEAIRLAALGYHFEKITRQQIAIHDFREFLAAELERFKQVVTQRGQDVEAGRDHRQKLFARVEARYKSFPEDFRYHGDGIEPAFETFRLAVNEEVERLTHVGAR